MSVEYVPKKCPTCGAVIGDEQRATLNGRPLARTDEVQFRHDAWTPAYCPVAPDTSARTVDDDMRGDKLAEVLGDTFIESQTQPPTVQWAMIARALRAHGLKIVSDKVPDASAKRCPREPTPEMLYAASDFNEAEIERARLHWIAMWDAAPGVPMVEAGVSTIAAPPDAAAPDCAHKWVTGRDAHQCMRCGDTLPLTEPRPDASASVLTDADKAIVRYLESGQTPEDTAAVALIDRLARELAGSQAHAQCMTDAHNDEQTRRRDAEAELGELSALAGQYLDERNVAQAKLVWAPGRIAELERKCKNQRGQLHHLQNAHDVLWKVIGLYLDRYRDTVLAQTGSLDEARKIIAALLLLRSGMPSEQEREAAYQRALDFVAHGATKEQA
jgi:hypothetical protein